MANLKEMTMMYPQKYYEHLRGKESSATKFWCEKCQLEQSCDPYGKWVTCGDPIRPHVTKKVKLHTMAKQTRAKIRNLEKDVLKLMAHPQATVEQIMEAHKMYANAMFGWKAILAKLEAQGIRWVE